MVKTRIVHDGVVYYSVGGAAKMLRTNTATVKRLMAERSLEWLNLRTNGRLVIPETSILDYQRHLLFEKRKMREHNP
jgi:hypothetical protein